MQGLRLILIENLASPVTTPKASARAWYQSKSQSQSGIFKADPHRS
jgi:hypothetical protein